MFGECHAHMIMNGLNYKQAVAVHENGPNDQIILSRLKEYQRSEILFVRDGGDNRNVSLRAAKLAQEFGIDYRTPVFAIHKKGHYGGIVGREFETMGEYYNLVKEVRRKKGDFIKIMVTGIMDFTCQGKITGVKLDQKEIKAMIYAAHEEGFAVMVHANGSHAVKDVLEAGADSLEHGNYMDSECIQILKESKTVWVPTAVTIKNLIGCGRFPDRVLHNILEQQKKNVKKAYDAGAFLALGSDAGAFQVPHCQGIRDEYDFFFDILLDHDQLKTRLADGETIIKERFKHNY